MTSDSRIIENPFLHKSSGIMDRDRKILTSKISSIIHKPILDILHEVTKFNVIETNKNVGGYFSLDKEEVAINPNSGNDNFQTLFHELGHWVHWINGYDFRGDKTMSHVVIEEQEVESFACKMYLDLFGIYIPQNQWAYYSREDIVWLNNYYNGYYQNDLI